MHHRICIGHQDLLVSLIQPSVHASSIRYRIPRAPGIEFVAKKAFVLLLGVSWVLLLLLATRHTSHLAHNTTLHT